MFHDIMQVTARLNNIRISPRKVRLVATLIKGLSTEEALVQLDATVKRSCEPLKKLLESAIANGENNFGLDKSNLYVYDAIVEAGPVLKRWMPKAYGRAGKILKRTSKIIITLEELEEGKGRKSKEEMEKLRAQKTESKNKEEKIENKESEVKDAKESKKEKVIAEKGEKAKTGGSGWRNKIFQRKSM